MKALLPRSFRLCLVGVAALVAAVRGVGEGALKEERQRLAEALRREDPAAVQEAVRACHAALGRQAGIPEVADVYQPVPAVSTPATAWLSREEAHALLPRFFRAAEERRFWKVGCDPTQLPAALRGPAAVISGMVAVRRARLPGTEAALPIALAAADFLIWAQERAGAGCYPFPAARGPSKDRAMQVAARFLERAEASGRLSATVRNGWAFEDHGDGGLQFDNGECGLAMLELHELTRDPRHLASALQAADWAAARPLCMNWNYNSFSVALLVKAHEVSGQHKYLEAALKKALLGVIPGQLAEGPQAGRWGDPHNARPAYHYIMLSALARLAAALPPGHAQRPAVMRALTAGLAARNAEITTQGVMTLDKALECLLLVHRLFPEGGSGNAAWLRETRTTAALDALLRFTSAKSRRVEFPAGPRALGEMLALVSQ